MKRVNLKSILPVALFGVLLLLFMTGCSNYEDLSECANGKNYGFWNGLWHGIIAPIDLIAMIWREDVTVYAPNNNGIWYAFGFVLGSGGWGFLGGKSSSSSRKRRREN